MDDIPNHTVNALCWAAIFIFILLFIWACLHRLARELRRSRKLHEEELRVLKELASQTKRMS